MYSEKIVKSPIHIFKGMRSLTLKELENRLLKEGTTFFCNNAYTSAAKCQGIFFDLSQVRWINIGAAVQLVLLVENIKKNNIQVYIALPFRRATKNEQKSQKLGDNLRDALVRSREKANNFFKIIQFDQAVRCNHIQMMLDVRITENFEFAENFEIENFIDSFSEKYELQYIHSDYSTYNYRYIFPLTWLNSKDTDKQLKYIEENFQTILTNENRGLSGIDVLSLKNVVLSELLKNVREHAGEDTYYALLAIGLMPTSTLVKTNQDKTVHYTNDIEGEYLSWLKNNEIDSFIEIYFGDAGCGMITTSLKEAYEKKYSGKRISTIPKEKSLKILEWSFDKWSTCKIDEKIRGTKGLYRINRIINKYNGVFWIRTQDLYGGFQKGGYDYSKWRDNSSNSLYFHPGTFIQIKLCPYKEAPKFYFNIQSNDLVRKWIALKYEVTENYLNDFAKLLYGNIQSDLNILLIIQYNHKSISIEIIKEFLNYALKNLCYWGHPTGIVVYFVNNIGNELLNEISHSINELLNEEAGEPDLEEIYDPILLIHSNNNISWFGGDPNIINILNEIYSINKDSLNIIESKTFKELNEDTQKKVLMYLDNANSLVRISNNKEIVFNFTNIQDLFREQIFSFTKEYHTTSSTLVSFVLLS